MTEAYLGPVILDVQGLELTAEDRSLLANPWVGGLILFTRNYSDPGQLQQLVADIRQVNPRLLLAVDHEGGRVQRFRDGFTRIPPMQTLGALHRRQPDRGLAAAADVGWLMASELLAHGVDISFAPVLDIDDSFSDIIGDRSFSSDPQQVTELAAAFIGGMQSAGMAVTGKHFPGHGGVKADSHTELPVDTRLRAALDARDLIPFRGLAGALDAVMPAHILFPEIDEQPVGFSPYWLQGILRQDLGFDGIIFSDDLSMEGAVSAGGYGERALASLAAGCDAVLVCNNREGAREVVSTLETALPEVKKSGLERMRARQSPHLEVVRSDPRYKAALAAIELLNEVTKN